LVPFLVTTSIFAPEKLPILTSKGAVLIDNCFIAPKSIGCVLAKLPGVPFAGDLAASLKGS